MKRKFLVAMLAILVISLFPITSHATSNEKPKTDSKATVETVKVDTTKYGITTPEKTSFSVDKKISLINGFAPQGTVINIKHFATTDLTGKKFNLLKLPKEKEYIELSTSEIIVGKFGVFDGQIDLVNGINLVRIDFNVDGVEDIEIIIFVNPNGLKDIDKTIVTEKITTLIKTNK